MEQDSPVQTGSGYQYFEVFCMNSSMLQASAHSAHISHSFVIDANDINPLGPRGEGEASPLLIDGRRRDILTAFQRYRNSRLSADFQTEITDRSLAECLDECLRQVSITQQRSYRI